MYVLGPVPPLGTRKECDAPGFEIKGKTRHAQRGFGRETRFDKPIIAAIVFEDGDETEQFLSSYDASLPFLLITKSSDLSHVLQMIFKMTAYLNLLQINLAKM